MAKKLKLKCRFACKGIKVKEQFDFAEFSVAKLFEITSESFISNELLGKIVSRLVK